MPVETQLKRTCHLPRCQTEVVVSHLGCVQFEVADLRLQAQRHVRRQLPLTP